MGNSVAEIVRVLEQVLPVLQAINTQQGAPQGSVTPAPSAGTSTATGTVDQADLQKVFDLIKTLTGNTPPPLGPVNGALGETVGNLLNGKKTAIGVIGALVTQVLSVPGISTAITAAIPALSGPIAPIALPIFLALAGWGFMGKMEKWTETVAKS